MAITAKRAAPMRLTNDGDAYTVVMKEVILSVVARRGLLVALGSCFIVVLVGHVQRKAASQC